MLWSRLSPFFEPHPSVREPYLRFALPKLAAYLFFSLCLSFCGIVFLLFDFEFYGVEQSWLPYQPHINLIIYLGLYWRSRSSQSKWAAELTILYTVILSFINLLMGPSQVGVIIPYMLIALLLGTMFLSSLLTVFLYVATILFSLGLYQQFINDYWLQYVGGISTYVVVGFVVLLQSWFQRSYEVFRISELAGSERRYRTLLTEAYDGMLTVRQNVIASIEPSLLRRLGFSAETTIGMPVETVLKDFEIGRIDPVGEVVGPAKNGENLYFEYVMVQDHGGEKNTLAIALRDITERRKTREALAHSQRVDSLGMLAGGIAHDFNNMLTGIRAQAQITQVKLSETSTAHKSVEKLLQIVDRATDLTHQLLAYAGKGSFEVKQFEFGQFVAEFLRLLHSNLPPHINLTVTIGDQSLPVLGDRRQIQQILLNLVVNAAQAIGEQSGVIQVDTTKISLPLANGKPTLMWDGTKLSSGEYVRLSVRDNGCGMDDETINEIFKPFFTTKESGTGLGLAATLGTLTAHCGNLQLFSQLGEGTEFVIWLPLEIDYLLDGRMM